MSDIDAKIQNFIAMHQPTNMSDITPFKTEEASIYQEHFEKKSEAASKMSLSEFGLSFHMSEHGGVENEFKQRDSIVSNK